MSVAGAMVGTTGSLFDSDRAFLHRPVERQVDVRRQFQIGQFSTLCDRLDDSRREKRQPYQARDVAIGDAFAAGDRSKRSCPARRKFLEPPMRPRDRLQQSRIGLARQGVGAFDDKPCLHTASLHSHRDEPRHRYPRSGSVGAIDGYWKVHRKLDAVGKRWQSGTMVLRWTAACVLEAERGFRKLAGYRALPNVLAALAQAEQKHCFDSNFS
jgi:hypothetical protein